MSAWRRRLLEALLVVTAAGLVRLCFRRTGGAGLRLTVAGMTFAGGVALALFGDGL